MEILDTPRQGCLLVSEPLLGDTTFEKTVIYLVAYSHEGAVGFIVNQVGEYMVGDLIDLLEECNMFIFNGGPVETQNLYFIHNRKDLIESNYHISEDYYWGGDVETLFHKIKKREITEQEVIFFRGYSGWAAGQLENEIKNKSWIVVDHSLTDLLALPPEERWSYMLRKLGGEYLLWINSPSNPVWN